MRSVGRHRGSSKDGVAVVQVGDDKHLDASTREEPLAPLNIVKVQVTAAVCQQ